MEEKTKGMNSPLKIHGGKHYLAEKYVRLMPPHIHYVEPYAGGLSVLLSKDPEGISEVVNDVYGHLASFWRVMQCPIQFPNFMRYCEATPFSQVCWNDAGAILEGWDGRDEALLAWAFFVHCRQSYAGRTQSFAPLTKRRTRRGMNEQTSAWLSAVEGLPEIHKRLMRVVVLNKDGVEVIKSQDEATTLHFCDPPYVHETRTVEDVYKYEMTNEKHMDLLDTIKQCKGKVMLCGYKCSMYDRELSQWNRHDTDMANHAAGGGGEINKKKRRMTESLWCNF